MARTNQRGSILEFIIIGGAMALLLVGGAYFVRRTLMPSDSTSGDSTVSRGDRNGSVDKSSGGVSDKSDKKADSDSQPAQDKDSEQSVDNKSEGDVSDQELAGGQSFESQGNIPGNLPQTGPADTLVGGFLVGSMVAAGAAYKRSRNSVSSL